MTDVRQQPLIEEGWATQSVILVEVGISTGEKSNSPSRTITKNKFQVHSQKIKSKTLKFL